ncbi:hypothetical protein GCM10011594_17020 [Nakamurella endophytica]|uniref:Uncharacterized protein n=1 Tax=Nakamurella endophytica TaxID=1748367 RepID=A0A917WF69_9ACTN|nr:hypothetical protein GCM10011594_17020 [Nakamurella endophytica]
MAPAPEPPEPETLPALLLAAPLSELPEQAASARRATAEAVTARPLTVDRGVRIFIERLPGDMADTEQGRWRVPACRLSAAIPTSGKVGVKRTFSDLFLSTYS